MKRLSEQTLYEILEVPPDAAAPDIEAAYERARSLYAPGSLATYALMSNEEAALLTSRLEEARATLLDAAARARYDEALAAQAAPANGAAAAATALPPVIAAARPGPPGDAPGAEPARPALLLAQAASAGAPAGGEPPLPIRLEREIPPPPPPARAPDAPFPEVASWTGDALRTAREARGITVQQIAERTKVTRHHIENIESERFGALPAAVYLRGILLAIARELRLDGQKVARSYLERAIANAAPPPPPAPPKAR